MPKEPTGDAAVRMYRQEISPAGMAKAHFDQMKALNDKYPGLYFPEVRTEGGLNKIQKQVRQVTVKPKK